MATTPLTTAIPAEYGGTPIPTTPYNQLANVPAPTAPASTGGGGSQAAPAPKAEPAAPAAAAPTTPVDDNGAQANADFAAGLKTNAQVEQEAAAATLKEANDLKDKQQKELVANATKDLDNDLENLVSQTNAMRASLSGMLQNTINNIQATYARRKDQMKLINENTLASQTIIGARSGRQRYAPEIQTGILSNEERAGVQRLADLDAEEQKLINDAQAAYAENDFKLFNNTWEKTQQIRQEKTNTIINLNKMAIDQENLLINKNKEIRDQQTFDMQMDSAKSDYAAASLIKTDAEGKLVAPTPAQIQAYAQANGIDPTILAATVQSTIGTMQDKQVSDYTNLLKQRQLEADLAMPKFQKIGNTNYSFTYNPATKTWTSKAVGSTGDGTAAGAIKFDVTDKQRLIGAGLSANDINNLEAYVNKNGFNESALKSVGMTDGQLQATKIVLSGAAKADAATQVLNMDDGSFTTWFNSYTDDDGYLDPSSLPDGVAPLAVDRATKMGLFDQKDDETSSFLGRLFHPFSN